MNRRSRLSVELFQPLSTTSCQPHEWVVACVLATRWLVTGISGMRSRPVRSRYLRQMAWWNDFWTWVNENQLATTIIGTLVAALILWVMPISRRGIMAGFRFLGTLRVRVTTQARLDEKERALRDQLKAAKKDGLLLGVEKTCALVAKADAGRDEARSELNALKEVPPQMPMWRVYPFESDGPESYWLKNIVHDPDLVMNNITLNAPPELFTFTGAVRTHAGASEARPMRFFGRRHTSAMIPFSISWNDGHGVRRQATTYLSQARWEAVIF